jgi:hypothetical protein
VSQYQIVVVNNSSKAGTYVVFQAPPPEFRGSTPAAAQAGWSVREKIEAGGSAEISFTPPPPKPDGLFAKLCARLLGAPPSPAPDRFHLTVEADGPTAASHLDFSASPTASTKILHGLDGGLSVAAASTLGYSTFDTPVGNLQPTLQGDDFVAPFNVTATFTNSAGSSCAAGEYRQMVMGQFSVNGSVLTHILCGSTVMSPAVFQEDGCPPGACTAFGYRACEPSPWSRYAPVQATGAQYAMYDQPGFTNLFHGATYVIDLQFRGELVDTAAGVTLAIRSWSVEGTIVAPSPSAPMHMVEVAKGFQASDRLVGVHLSHNLADGGPEVHVVIARAWGSPRLDPNAVKVTLVDAEGQPVTAAEPAAHEVGGKRGTTATIVHRLLPGQATPVKATFDIGGQLSEMAIAAA